jgi:hypothetical protein
MESRKSDRSSGDYGTPFFPNTELQFKDEECSHVLGPRLAQTTTRRPLLKFNFCYIPIVTYDTKNLSYPVMKTL